MVGRRLELRQLKALLADNSVRLITLTGTGGVGKSTLMAELYVQMADHADAHTARVDASAARSAQAVIGAIASALGIEGAQGAHNELILADTLRDRPYLLMIDGAEQPDLAAPFALLLDRCPHTRLLVATRSLLQLDCEQVQVLDGFPLPDADETDADVLSSNDGVHYFARMMRRTGHPSDLIHDARGIAGLVRAVEGLPLALKLLAKLARVFPLPQLLDSVRNHSANAIGLSPPALDELMPALIASFERSWMVLVAREQAVLSRLAVFPAAFDVAAACAVAHTELPVITSLIDRSLVRSDGAGKLSLHASTRACVLAICPSAGSATVAYLAYFTQLLARLAHIAKFKSARPIDEFLRDSEAHVRTVWQLALQQRAHNTLQSLAESLTHQIQIVGSADDYGTWFFEAEARLRHDISAPPGLRAQLLAGVARAARFQGQNDLAAARAREALRTARQARLRTAMYPALEVLIRVNLVQGKLREADSLLHSARKMDGETAGVFFNVGLLSNQALALFLKGDREAAVRLSDQIVSINRRFDDFNAEMRALLNKVFFANLPGDRRQAITFLNEAVVRADTGDVSSALLLKALCDLASLHLDAGDIPRAQLGMRRANLIACRVPQSMQMHLSLQLSNAMVELAVVDIRSAARRLITILDALGSGHELGLASRALVATAEWFHLVGDRDACVKVLRAIPAEGLSPHSFDTAQKMLSELGEVPVPQTEAALVNISGSATAARLRMLTLLDEMQQSKPL